ncbi:ferredoxin family protein [Escherichia albertii]|uniref:ferredoxin family protein n=1 Tax=Escherichia albertii TaxID=208962 RepID=UPI000F61C588|nr:ferredoxin family protein [Escherichia albertii]EFZ2303775.1 ferredoxin family protein [Shigella boydii]EFG1228201.1 ferredoxin family protein [Escherichia albertii]EFZ6209570.1 ferredoxin family protein [Shigella boydii]EFZ6296564.1 ferredoxin family protein [Shigella boydii]EFZ6324882.1 ferredoxin family protein [Shigella boydii]
MNTVNVDVKLGVNKFYVDEGNPHIVLNEQIDPQLFQLLVMACPAGLYRCDGNGHFLFDYAGCLECGTCRVLCEESLLAKWQYPVGTLGIEYRHG